MQKCHQGLICEEKGLVFVINITSTGMFLQIAMNTENVQFRQLGAAAKMLGLSVPVGFEPRITEAGAGAVPVC
jgi:hypothetical protein